MYTIKAYSFFNFSQATKLSNFFVFFKSIFHQYLLIIFDLFNKLKKNNEQLSRQLGGSINSFDREEK